MVITFDNSPHWSSDVQVLMDRSIDESATAAAAATAAAMMSADGS